MSEEKVCDNCKFATNHERVVHPHGEYIRLDCTAPIPGHIALFGDEGKGIGHKAAERCAVYEPQER